MRMHMWLSRRIIRAMGVLMMFIMRVPVLVFFRLMDMFVLVAFGKMQPQPDGHQTGGNEKTQ